MDNNDFEAEKLEHEIWADQQLDKEERLPWMGTAIETFSNEIIAVAKQSLLTKIDRIQSKLHPKDADAHFYWTGFRNFINNEL